MRIDRGVLCALLAFVITPASYAASLPDTGVILCDDGANNMVTCDTTSTGDAATMARQDGRFGRDPAAGGTGFDYTKVCNSGELAGSGSCPSDPALGSGTNQWGCTQDNITGLMWEVKVNDNTHLRHKGWTYTWYNSNAATNGGDAGEADAGASAGSDNCFDSTRCDTEKYIADVNTTALCSYGDWRLPSKRMLRSIIHFASYDSSVDISYFPNTITWMYWTASTMASTPTSAWQVNFTVGQDLSANKSYVYGLAYPVQLVRGETF